jgi:hypothetical protein
VAATDREAWVRVSRYPWVPVPRYVDWLSLACPRCRGLMIAPLTGMPGKYMSYEGDCACGVHFTRGI